MDFYGQQDRARRSTLWLLLLFSAGVVGVVIAVNVAAFGILELLGGAGAGSAHAPPAALSPQDRVAGNWPLFAGVSVVTLLVVLGGSAYRTAQLSGGGEAVAQALGCRPIAREGSDHEQMLQNVVEEMAIASGLPVPSVYVMDREPGINAFAAGLGGNDAVIGVTRGCLEGLSRDELQGVIAHEFSHILNGDMRLNVRLMGWLHGILLLSIIGGHILNSLRYTRVSGGRNNKGGGGVLVIVLGAFALMLIGSIGTLMARLIQAAISRQREYLADASAVQFTRNPSGLAGALKRIASHHAGTHVAHAEAAEAAHMFFGNVRRWSVSSLLATHPPIEKRIRAIEPTWDGRLPEPRERAPAEPRRPVSRPPTSPRAVAAARVAQLAGNLSASSIERAGQILDGIPASLRAAAAEPFSARAIVHALLLGEEREVAARQIDFLHGEDAPLARETARLHADIRRLDPAARLPLLELTAPALQRLSPSQRDTFLRRMRRLIATDQRMTVHEYAILRQASAQAKGTARPARSRFLSVQAVGRELAAMLSVLSRASGDADAAYAQAHAVLGLRPPPRDGDARLDALDAALDRLAEAAPAVQRRALDAAAACVAADGQVAVAEGELLRAIAASLGCPVPPLVDAAA